MVNVALKWKALDWHPEESWSDSTRQKLEGLGLDKATLKRSVYVIRLNGAYCVEYPFGKSPAIYVGEGNFSQRIKSHREWVAELSELVGKSTFEVRISTPRVRNNLDAYRDAEAAILIRFEKRYGSLPLWNKQKESRRSENYIYDQRDIDQAISQGSGKRYKWCFKPMRSSPFYANYLRTHRR